MTGSKAFAPIFTPRTISKQVFSVLVRTSLRRISVSLPAALLLAASLPAWLPLTALAQETPAPTPPPAQETSPDLAVIVDENKPAVAFQSLRDFSSFGGYLGLMKIFGGDLGENSEAKPVMQGVFRYRFSDNWVGIGDFGFGWNSFKDRGDTVATFNFGTIGVARRFGSFVGFDTRLTGGAGAYRYNYKYRGKSLRDPDTQRFYRGISLGGYLGAEAERRISRHVTLVGSLQQHMVFSADKKLFHSVFDENYPFASFRIGANYHFSPYEGILWEKKRGGKIVLESGRDGK